MALNVVSKLLRRPRNFRWLSGISQEQFEALERRQKDRYDKAISLLFGSNKFEIEKNKLAKILKKHEINDQTYIKKLIQIHEDETDRYHRLIFDLYALHID